MTEHNEQGKDDGDGLSDAYQIEKGNMYIECKLYKGRQVLTMDIFLHMYPHLQDKLEDIFDVSCSLTDLARELEKDLVIVEVDEGKFEIKLKRDLIDGIETRLKSNANSGVQTARRSQNDEDESYFTPSVLKNIDQPISVRSRPQSDVVLFHPTEEEDRLLQQRAALASPGAVKVLPIVTMNDVYEADE